MTQWEIWSWDFPEVGVHPAVIISHPRNVANKAEVNILYCASQRASRPANANEVMLDQADGLNWETLCRCDQIWLAKKSKLKEQRGTVVLDRQIAIAQRLIASFALRLYR